MVSTNFLLGLGGLLLIAIAMILLFFVIGPLEKAKQNIKDSKECKEKNECPTGWHTFGITVIGIIMMIILIAGCVLLLAATK